jgi:hypothetical protein
MPDLPKPGEFTKARGFVTRLIFVINKSASYLEDAIGYHRGRLSKGWSLLLLKEKVAPSEIVLAGYSYFSGGRIGHPMRGDVRETVEAQALGFLDLGRVKQSLADSFVLTGPQRIVKVIPATRHDDAMPEPEQYPVGRGIPQWILTADKTFIVAATVRADMDYLGGGPDGGRAGFWVDPRKAHTL